MEVSWNKKLEELSDDLLMIKKKQRKARELEKHRQERGKHVTFLLPDINMS